MNGTSVLSEGRGVEFARSAPAGEGLSPGVLARHRVPAHLARRFHQICLGVVADILMPEVLRPIEYAVLAAVDDHPGLDQRRLAAALGIDTTSIGQMVDRLALQGWVERKLDSADRRIRQVVPTSQGHQLRQRLRPALLAAQLKILEPLQPDEQETLLSLLARVVAGNNAYARPGNGRRKSKRTADEFCS
jgi:MarR family transcriptional regulator, temperature-dependent positive regulator of motility